MGYINVYRYWKLYLFIVFWLVSFISIAVYLNGHPEWTTLELDNIVVENNITMYRVYTNCSLGFINGYQSIDKYQKATYCKFKLEKPPKSYLIYQLQLKLNLWLKVLAMAYISWFVWKWRKEIMNWFERLSDEK